MRLKSGRTLAPLRHCRRPSRRQTVCNEIPTLRSRRLSASRRVALPSIASARWRGDGGAIASQDGELGSRQPPGAKLRCNVTPALCAPLRSASRSVRVDPGAARACVAQRSGRVEVRGLSVLSVPSARSGIPSARATALTMRRPAVERCTMPSSFTASSFIAKCRGRSANESDASVVSIGRAWRALDCQQRSILQRLPILWKRRREWRASM